MNFLSDYTDEFIEMLENPSQINTWAKFFNNNVTSINIVNEKQLISEKQDKKILQNNYTQVQTIKESENYEK
jgi:hypothetical protein